MLSNIKVIAFDIDGTLYPAGALYRRLLFYVLKNLKFYLSFSKVRRTLHKTAPLPDFYEYQGRLLAERLGCSAAEARGKIDAIVYKGLTPYLEKVKPFKYVEEAFIKFREAGYKIVLLSDFPPEQKGNVWGLAQYCDLIFGSEALGALKPSKYPFGAMTIAAGVKPEEVLYVGNSIKYDVQGANAAGMKSALIISKFKRLFSRKAKQADICFSNYRQLINIVLQ